MVLLSSVCLCNALWIDPGQTELQEVYPTKIIKNLLKTEFQFVHQYGVILMGALYKEGEIK